MFLSIRDFTVKWVGYEDLFGGLEDLGIDSFELFVSRDLRTSHYVDMGHRTELGLDVSSRERRLDIKRTLADRGFSICAILLENDFSRPELDKESKYVIDGCKVAHDLGVEVVRINALMRELPGYTIDDSVSRMVRALRPCLNVCEDLGVSLAVENHGVIGNNEDFLRKLFDEAGSGHLGLTLDTGNFYWYGYPLSKVYAIVEEMAGLVRHTHVKNATVPEDLREARRKPGEVKMAPLFSGDIDLGRIINTLRSAGYDYDINIEDESLGQFRGPQRLRVLKRDIEFLRTLI